MEEVYGRSWGCWIRHFRKVASDVAAVRLWQEEDADERADGGEDDGVPEAGIGVAGGGDDGERGGGQEAADPAGGEVVRGRERGVADARGEELDQERGHGREEHGGDDGECGDDGDDHWFVDAGGIGCCWIAGG